MKNQYLILLLILLFVFTVECNKDDAGIYDYLNGDYENTYELPYGTGPKNGGSVNVDGSGSQFTIKSFINGKPILFEIKNDILELNAQFDDTLYRSIESDFNKDYIALKFVRITKDNATETNKEEAGDYILKRINK